VFHAVSYLLPCLPELSNNTNQRSTSYALLRHDCFSALTNIKPCCSHSDTRAHMCLKLYV